MKTLWLIFALFLYCNAPNKEVKKTTELKYSGNEAAFEFPINTEWINTKYPIQLKDLKGKVVIIHFWRYSSINCIHTISDLKKLNEKWKNELVIIGVHSPKFLAEQNTLNLKQAVLRLGIEYPIINGRDFNLWRQYGISSWPSFILIDPNGMVLGIQSGEGIYDGFSKIIEGMISEFANHDLLHREKIVEIESIKKPTTKLLFPGKLILNNSGTELIVADTGHNRILRIDIKTKKIIDIIGDSEAGLKDGRFFEAKFNKPQGLSLKDDSLYISDSENHSIRLANLKTKKVKTIAGTGEQARTINVSGKGKQVELNSPYDILEYKSKLYITMKGSNQIWILDLNTLEAEVFSGFGTENISDGKLEYAAFASPSGITKDAIRLYSVDSETSAVRSIDLISSMQVKTLLGKGLFEFGDVDGTSPSGRLQYPTAINFNSGSLYIADTFNNKIKKIDLETKAIITIAGNGKIGAANGQLSESNFFEPSGIAVYKNLIYVSDTNNHLIRLIDLETNIVSNFDF